MGSAQPTPYQESCFIFSTSQRAALPAGCPLTLASTHLTSPALSCICAECLHPVLTKTSQHVITALPPSSVTLLQHLHTSRCVSIALCYYSCAGSLVLSPVESVFLCTIWCFSLHLPLTFALLSSSPHLTWNISWSIASCSLLCSIRWLTAQESWVVCLGCSGGQGLRSGRVGEVPRGFEGDKIHIHFIFCQLMLLKAVYCSC